MGLGAKSMYLLILIMTTYLGDDRSDLKELLSFWGMLRHSVPKIACLC